MAGKTSASTGMLVTFTLTGVLAIAMFITTVVFFGRWQRAVTDLAQARDENSDIISPRQRGDDDIRLLIEQARSANQSLVAFLHESLRGAMEETAGAPTTTLAELRSSLENIDGADTTPLVQLVRDRDQRIAALQSDLASMESALEAARADLQSEVDRVQRIQQEHAATVAALQDQLDQYESGVNQYRDSVEQTISQNNDRVAEIRRSAAEREDSLSGRIAELQNELIVLQDAVRELRTDSAEGRVSPQDEFALVDARVLGTNPAQNEVYISLGRSDRITVGMTFEVYANSTAIRPDEEGNYPAGKASIEIIRINEGSSTARVIRSNTRNPVLEGDVVANAVYDPDKIYTFLVFGNFDTNDDQTFTQQEGQAIRGLIADWGGRVVDELTGSTDFLVLGQRPILPPEPSTDAPLPVIQDYIRKKQGVEEYDRLFRIASQTSIPILNQNRLYTLTGLTGTR